MNPPQDELRGIAHDLNNYLGAILNYSALLSRQITDPTARSDVDQISAAARAAADRANDLSNLATVTATSTTTTSVSTTTATSTPGPADE